MTNGKQSSAVLEAQPAVSSAEWSQLAERELVRRIVTSATFSKSERLSSLLTYVCAMSLKGRASELNEQKIGHAVFGRSRDYDSSADGIVRTQASRLRQRLALYFQNEGADEPLGLAIPRGSYVPVFESRVATPPQPEVPVIPAETAAVSVVKQMTAAGSEMPFTFLQAAPWLLCAVLAVGLGTVLVRGRIKAEVKASGITKHPLWGQIFVPGKPVLEVPGDSGLVLFHKFDARNVSLNEYLLGEYRTSEDKASGLSAVGDVPISGGPLPLSADMANRRYTSIVDLDAASVLAQMAAQAHTTMQIRYARDLRPNDLKNGSVILVGAFEANPWVELFERNMNFVLQDDYRTLVFSVVNRSPQPGEPRRWDSTSDDPQRRVYGVVAFAPNLGGNGNALVIEGTSMAGTEAAWDFVSDDTQLMPFLKKIQRADGSIPHFELLLGTQNMNSSAVRTNLLAWRVTN